MAADILHARMRARPYLAAWIEVVARPAALAVLVCAAEACTGPGLEPPDSAGRAGTGGHAGSQSTGGTGGAGAGGGSGSGGSGGFSPPTGGTGAAGEDDADAGEAPMDAGVDHDEDGGVEHP